MLRSRLEAGFLERLLHDDADRNIFDCVIVINDRRVLDQQLQDAIYSRSFRSCSVGCCTLPGRKLRRRPPTRRGGQVLRC